MDAAMNVRLGIKTKAFDTKMKQLSWRLNKLGKKIAAVGSSMSRNFTLPFALAGAASVKLALDFEKSMTKIQTLVGKTESEINSMKDSIMEISGETSKSPVELAEGLYFLESAGLRGANAIETLNNVAKGSASGLGDMEALSVVAAAAQNAYGKETLTASEALDKFGVMVRTGMFDAQELSNVLGRQLGLASNLGISFDEVGALISTYTQTTGDATAATNGLSAIMMTFAKLESEPTLKQAEALDKIKMSAQDVKTMMGEQGLVKTMQHLKTQFDANGIPMADFFTKSQALKGALGVLGSQTEALTNNFDAMTNSTGFIADAFATTADTDAFKMEQALNSLKVAGTQFGNSLLPVVMALTEKIQALTSWWTGLDESTRKNIATMGLWIAILGPAILMVGKIVIFGGKAVKMYKAWRIATLAAGGVQMWFNAVLTANPIGLIITAVAALIAAIIYFSTANSKVAKQVRNVFKFMANGIIFSINKIIAGINMIGGIFGKTITPLKMFKYESTDTLDEVGDAVDDTSDKVLDLNKNLNNLNIPIPDPPDGDDDIESDSDKDKRVEQEKSALENIRRLKQQFAVLNTKDKQAAELLALNQQEINAKKEVTNTVHSTDEKLAIENVYAKKRTKLEEKHAQENKKKTDEELSNWEEMFKKIEKGWNAISDVINQLFNSWGKLSQAQMDKEKQILENKHTQENEEYETWYERELMKIENSTKNEEEKNNAIDELDVIATDRKKTLEIAQDDETAKIQKKAAKRDKKMKIMSAIMGTAQAVVTALGSTVAPFNFILAALVGAMGAAQIATIASTPIPALAEGGIAFGPTLAQVGEYKGASSNPEVIAPLHKLQGMLNQEKPSRIEIFGRLDGNDIWLSNNLANTNRKRFT
tara:strand:- start:2769 stop:5414 length:2646 start_codon:yes stop_codon:yes gene_type:complete